MDKPEFEASWRNTKQKQRQKRMEGSKSTGSGCIGCFGMLCVTGAALYVMLESVNVLLQRGVDFLADVLGEAAVGEIGGESVAPNRILHPHTVMVAALVMVAGLLIIWLPEWIKSRKWSDETEQLAANIQGDWDRSMVEKRRKSAQTSKTVWIGLVLLTVPVLLFPVVRFLPLHPLLAPALGIGEILCVGIGLIVVVVGAFQSVMRFSQMGKRNDFKAQFVHTELQRIFADVLYEPMRELAYPLIADTHLVDNGNHYRGNDYICARYKGIFFEQADVTIKDISQRRSSGDRRSLKTTAILRFQGRWFVLEAAKTIQGEFYIFNRSFPVSRQVRQKGVALEAVVTEDSVFNGAFSILATNPHDVFYLFTPILIDKLKDFAGLHSGDTVLNGIGLYCRGNQIHVAVSNVKDAFEPGIVETGSEQQIRDRLRGEMSLITDIIGALA